MLQRGKTYVIKGYNKEINPQYRLNLLAMGLIPGASFLVKRFAPFSSTVQIELEQFNLSLRANELQQVRLETI
jgi:ferrous iron transport protein A